MKLSVVSAACCRIFLVFLLVLCLLGPVFAEESPIQIEADTMTSTEKDNSVVFTGNVDAKQADVRIRSDKMTVHYTQADTKTKGPSTATQQVNKLICDGNVEITRGEWLGTSKHMVYLSKERQVILTGNAKAWQGQNMVNGDKIIYYLDEGRSEVVSDPVATTAGKDKGTKKTGRVNMTILQK